MSYTVNVIQPQPVSIDSQDQALILLNPNGAPEFVSDPARQLITLGQPERWSEAWSCVSDALTGALESLRGDPTVIGCRTLDFRLSREETYRSAACTVWKVPGVARERFLLVFNEGIALADLQAATRWRTLLRLLPGIIHSLRNPLNTMGINLLLLQEMLETSETGAAPGNDPLHYVKVLQEESERLGRLLNSFLGELLATTPRNQPADLPAVLSELATFIAPLTRRQSIVFNLRVPDERVPVMDRDRHIEQALLNILVNALEALPAQGRLDLSLTHDDGRATITVADSGSGVAPTLLPLVFDRHVTGRADPAASGIGLYVARHLIQACGGELRLSSQPGEGTRVEIILPVAGATAPPPAG